MAAEGRLLFHIADFERKLDIVSKKSAETSRKVKQETAGIGAGLSDGLRSGLKSALPTISVAAIGAGIKASLQRADDLADLKLSLGETAETLQRVDFAAQQAASVGVEELAQSFLKLEKNLGDFENKNAATALSNLGVTAAGLASLPLDEKILTLSQAFQKARAEGTGVKDIMDLLGRSGASLVPMLAQSEEALRSLFAEAPVVADDMIDRMAVLNDQFDGLVAKAKTFGMEVVAGWVGVGQFVGDVISTGSIDEAGIRRYERDTAATQSVLNQRDAKEVQAAALAAEKEAAARAKSAEEAEKAVEAVEKLKEAIAKSDFDLLPDDAKLAALKSKLEVLLKDTVGLFSLNFDTSLEGLEALAKSREAMGDKLPTSGQNSAAEAWTWLQEAKQLSRDRAELEKQIADKEKSAAEAKAKELDGLRDKAASVEFELLSPEDQARKLTEQLSKSFGFDITGVEAVERGLVEARERVRAARDAGDTDAERAALEKLNAAQDMARDLAGLNGDNPEDAVVNGRGSVAGAVANIFGRSSADLQLDEAKIQTTLLGNIETVLTKIWESDNKPPFPGDPFFTYP